MALHANAEERCERGEIQIQEGVDQDKMRMITETRGISWDGIFEILFPGAPVPSPCKCYRNESRNAVRADLTIPDYGIQDLPAENVEQWSPRSLELREFETYNRTALPLLVEAHLRALMESEIAPIEERVRAMVIDILRDCQSTVARRFHMTRSSTLLANNQMPALSQATTLDQADVHMSTEYPQLPTDETAEGPLNFFHELPHVTSESGASLPGPMTTATGFQDRSSDSGYASLRTSCGCSCHENSDNSDLANGEKRSDCFVTYS